MISGTTPTYTLRLSDSSNVDLTEATKVFFAISQGTTTIKKQVFPLNQKQVEATLTQSESLSLKPGKPTLIQLNWIYQDGQRMATKPVCVTVELQLLNEVLS